MSFSKTIHSLEDLEIYSKSFADEIKESKEINHILLLYAKMGSGKTTFTGMMGKALGIKTRITSPSFIGLNHYSAEIDLYHYDCYQVTPILEEFCEILEDPKKKIIVIEWAENLNPQFLKNMKGLMNRISIEVLDNEARLITRENYANTDR